MQNIDKLAKRKPVNGKMSLGKLIEKCIKKTDIKCNIINFLL